MGHAERLVFAVCAVCAAAAEVDPRTLGLDVVNRDAEVDRITGLPVAPSRTRWAGEWLSSARALPTNEWWTNLVQDAGPGRYPGLAHPVPYTVEACYRIETQSMGCAGRLVRGLVVNYPWQVSESKVYHEFYDAIMGRVTLETEEDLLEPTVTKSDDLVTHLQWISVRGNGNLTAILARGSPYISVVYSGRQRLVLNALESADWVRADGKEVKCGDASGEELLPPSRKVTFSLKAMGLTWAVYLPRPLSLKCRSTDHAFRLSAEKSTRGMVRLALVNNCTTGHSWEPSGAPKFLYPGFCDAPGVARNSSAYEAALDAHAEAVPIGSDVQFLPQTYACGTNSTAECSLIKMMWDVRNATNLEQPALGPLLWTAKPHHLAAIAPENVSSHAALKKPSVYSWLGHRLTSGFGTLVSIPSSSFDMWEEVPDLSLVGNRPIDPSRVADVKEAVLDEALNRSVERVCEVGAGMYSCGKELAARARIAAIAKEVGLEDTSVKVASEVAEALKPWTDGGPSARVVYDETWGGLVFCACSWDGCWDPKTSTFNCNRCDNDNGQPPGSPAKPKDCSNSLENSGFEYGNAFYNDHHYHYGYIMYAAAVVGELMPDWLSDSRFERLRLYARDVASIGGEVDPFFPRFRHFDFYTGHSWAAGMAQAPRYGRNQESVSEAINAWYGLASLGKTRRKSGDVRGSELFATGRTLLALELRGAHTYWQKSELYPPHFLDGIGAVGILHETLVEEQTFFGSNPYYVIGIQTIPFTPAAELLLRREWVEAAYPFYNASCAADEDCVSGEDGWIAVEVGLLAVLNASAAWEMTKGLNASSVFAVSKMAGNPNTLSNTLHWIATRPSAPQYNDIESRAATVTINH